MSSNIRITMISKYLKLQHVLLHFKVFGKLSECMFYQQAIVKVKDGENQRKEIVGASGDKIVCNNAFC